MPTTVDLDACIAQLKAFANFLTATVLSLQQAGRDQDALNVAQAQSNVRFAGIELNSMAVAAIFASNAQALAKLQSVTNDLDNLAAKIAADETRVDRITQVATAVLALGTACTSLDIGGVLSSLSALSAAINS
ncbi:MAG TPA: hypothetical protein VEV38_01705 [Candidatus Eremiobacteraceae bacterium]|nr:hypothetical protein [Candidatus Eremiobacteraceae bacterium]